MQILSIIMLIVSAGVIGAILHALVAGRRAIAKDDSPKYINVHSLKKEGYKRIYMDNNSIIDMHNNEDDN